MNHDSLRRRTEAMRSIAWQRGYHMPRLTVQPGEDPLLAEHRAWLHWFITNEWRIPLYEED